MRLQLVIRSLANLLTTRVKLDCGDVRHCKHGGARDPLLWPADNPIFAVRVPRSRTKNACHTMGLGPVVRMRRRLSGNARPDGGPLGYPDIAGTRLRSAPAKRVLSLTISPRAYSPLARVHNR